MDITLLIKNDSSTFKFDSLCRSSRVYTNIWKPLIGEYLQCVKEPAKKRMLLLWFILILTVKKSWLAMC